MIGRYKQPRLVDIKAIAHITGGGLPGNVIRILKNRNLGARIENLPEPHEAVLKVKEFGNVSDEEAYKTWNMGVGMVIVSNEFDKIKKIADNHDVKAYKIGDITDEPGISIEDLRF